MENIKDVHITNMTDSAFCKPLRMTFKQNDRDRFWDLVEVHESVCIIIYNVTREALVFVKQFRPAVYYNSIPKSDRNGIIDVSKYPASLGLTLELCAGIVDKKKTLAEIACEEIYEECGYQVDPENLEQVMQFRSGVGISGDLQTLFYVEVTDEMQVNEGGGNPEEGEFIEVVHMPINKVEEMMKSGSVIGPGGFLYAVQWFLHNKAPKSS